MSRYTDLASTDEDQKQLAELLRSNEILREELREANVRCAHLEHQLREAAKGSQADRENRRAALNLMEDAVEARTAEQRENSERRRIEEELRQADRRKDEFLATLAHELRTPLAPIRNSLNILRLARVDLGTATEIREMMERQVNHMVRLIDDLMEVSRISRGRIELRKEPVQLANVVQNALEVNRPLIAAAGHQLKVSIPSEPLVIEADSVRLAQVVANLLNNAAKYTQDGGVISLTVEREDSRAKLTIHDNGSGIPPEMQTKIFDLFTQLDRTYDRAQGGLGIGLTLVRSLVEMHGGTVEVHSGGVGQGSDFVVRLPLVESDECVLPAPTDKASFDVEQCRVLVVDDNRDAADSLGTLLTFLGANVHSVHDGQSALSILPLYQPSVVLLDIGMPGMDGFEVARRLRQMPAGKNVQLIALTGWGQAEDRRRSKEAGFDHHLVKPVELSALQAVLSAQPTT